MEELIGRVDVSREILTRAANEMRSEWKIFLEAVLLEMRAGNILKAIHVSHYAVTLHPGTGRLWAIYIQLCHRHEFLSALRNFVEEKRIKGRGSDDDNDASNLSHFSPLSDDAEASAVKRALFQTDAEDSPVKKSPISMSTTLSINTTSALHNDECSQNGTKSVDSNPPSSANNTQNSNIQCNIYSNTNLSSIIQKDKIIRRAIAEVPKSGEVWCEKCRCHLNPLHVGQFDLTQAQRSLCFAIQFTPQYGDSFIEYIRLEMICQVILFSCGHIDCNQFDIWII